MSHYLLQNHQLQAYLQEEHQKIVSKSKSKNKNKNKKINFNKIVSAILIPSIKDMDDEMRSKLWWNKIDYKEFYVSSKAEIDMFLNIHKDLKYRDATRLLYQHGIICYEPYIDHVRPSSNYISM